MNKSLRLDIEQDERTRLKAEFDQLESIEQKYNFWAEKLERNYFLWAFYEQDNIKDFQIVPKNEFETEILNKLIYSDYSLVNSANKKLNARKKSFNEQIETCPDKETFIDYEIKNIEDLIFKRKQDSFPTDMNQYEKDNFFIRGYEDYLLKKKEIDWKERVYQAHLLQEKIQGIEWAKYREYVKTYLMPKKIQVDIQLNGEQKVLALHHLGLGIDIENATIRAKLYNSFIPELNQETIRGLFSRINDHYKKEQNKDKLLEFFRSIKLNSKARLLEDKIDKLK